MDSLPINVTDLAIIAVVVISGLLAFVRGFVHEVLAVGAWVGAAIVTVFFLPVVLPYARDLISIQIAADIAGGAAIFIFVLIVLSIFTHWLARRVRESSLGALDRSLGLLFGFLRGAILVCLAWIGLVTLLPRDQHPDWIQEAPGAAPGGTGLRHHPDGGPGKPAAGCLQRTGTGSAAIDRGDHPASGRRLGGKPERGWT